jgi:hypothetical protein
LSPSLSASAVSRRHCSALFLNRSASDTPFLSLLLIARDVPRSGNESTLLKIESIGGSCVCVSPSIVPTDRLDRDIYIVLEDFGARAGCAWRETDEQDTDLQTVLQGLLFGQYVYLVRIVCFNASEWSRDATSEAAEVVAQRAVEREDEVSAALRGFICADGTRRFV